MTATKADPRTFSITTTDRYYDTNYHLESHTLTIQPWGLQVVGDNGDVMGFPWPAVTRFTIGHIPGLES